jgi:hypothetical protein
MLLTTRLVPVGQQSIDSPGRLPLARWDDMAGGIHSQADLAVPAALHHDARMDPLGEQQRGTGMKVMEALVWQPSLAQDALKVPGDIPGIQWRADGSGDRPGTRTLNPLIKSQLLYRLS